MKLKTTLVIFLLPFFLAGCQSLKEPLTRTTQTLIADDELGISEGSANSMGEWKIDRSVSIMDDSVKITASLGINYLSTSERHRDFTHTTLNFSCTKGRNDIEVFIDFGEPSHSVAIFPNNPVHIRFDKDGPLTSYWDSKYPLNQHKVPFHIVATGRFESPGSPSYLRNMKLAMGFLKNRDRMLIQITPVGHSKEMILGFRISGFSNAFKNLEVCDLDDILLGPSFVKPRKSN